MKHLLPLVILTNCLVTQGVLEWTVIGKVTDYGQNVTLFCNVSNCCPKDAGWDMWTPEQRTLYIDVKTGRSNKKYDGKIMKDGYTLVIQNLTEQDLNVSYSCLYDFTLGTQKFLLEEDVFTYIRTTQPNDSTGNSTVLEGQIAGIIVGIAVAGVAVCLFVFLLRKQKTCNNNGNAGYFLKDPSNIVCYEGDEAIIICEVRSNSPSVKWKKGTNDLAENDNYEISSNGKEQQLKLKRPKPDDSGEYFVHVGESFRKVQLNIIAVSKVIKELTEEQRMKYIKLMKESAKEKRHFVRIMIVGKERVGKTCLLRRLLNESIKDVKSTDGIDIVVRQCKINIDDGKWTIGKDISDNRVHRMQNVLNQNESMEKETILQHERLEYDVSKIDVSESSDLVHQQAYNNEFHMEVQVGNQNDIRNGTTTIPSKFETSKPIVEQGNVNTKDEGNISLHEESTDTKAIKSTKIEKSTNIYKKDNKTDEHGKHNKLVTITDTETTLEKDDGELEMPEDLMSQIFSSSSTSNSPTNHYALCGLWDFAGQKEFYATHQVFLTSSAIYLVVADMETDVWKEKKEYTKEQVDETQCLTTDGEFVDFWFESIHCYKTDPPKDEASNLYSDPPVIVVFTGADKYDKKDLKEREQELNKQLISVNAEQSKYKHFRKCFFLSNLNKSDEEFVKLRKTISETAKKMASWGETVPLKYILLEHLIEMNKKKGMNFMTFNDIVKLANHQDVAISDPQEVILFLNVQSKEGNIIYFKDIENLIILEPQWLVDAFRCLVSDKLEINNLIDKGNRICLDVEKLRKTGKISDLLITKLFTLKKGQKFLEQREDLVKVMKKFDILVHIKKTDTYIMPSMIPFSDFKTVCETIGVFKTSCERTSWFCLKFKFLPRVFFNHLSAWLIQTYIPSKWTDGNNSLALFREICVFDFILNGCDKLLMAMSTDTIAVQVVSFDKKSEDLSDLCTSVRKPLIQKIEDIKERYSLNLSYEERFKCSAGKYDTDTISLEALRKNDTFYCLQHQSAHASKLLYSPWTKDEMITYQMPDAVKQMSEHDRNMFLKASKPDTTVRYNIRIMIVGESGVGKTCLLRRLMNEPIDDVRSTDGINIEVKKCKINRRTQKWIFTTDEEFSKTAYQDEDFAECGFWDFAGDKEFYATHQTFLSSNAIYLLVVDISKDFGSKTHQDMIDNEFDKVGEHIDFWLDHIHCYALQDKDGLLNPPVILIGTGIDKLRNEEDLSEKKKMLYSLLDQKKQIRRHVRKTYFLSNKEPEKYHTEFENVRKEIFEGACNIPKWGENLPTRWIVLEKEIDRFIAEEKKLVISYEVAKQLAKMSSFPIGEIESELDSFLKYEHEIGNLIFFDDIKSYIVLEPKWLVDIFRCFVSPLQFQENFIEMIEWKTLESTGILPDSLIKKLFKKVPQFDSVKHTEFALQIMEKFDIIVKPTTLTGNEKYYMPCMINASDFETITKIFNVQTKNCSRTSWLCLDFNFLPPSFFNHLLVTLVKEYILCTDKDGRVQLYRSIGIFNLETNGCKKLVACLSENAIAVQVWEYHHEEQHTCNTNYSNIREYLISTVNLLQRRYKMNIKYACFFKCPEGKYYKTAGKVSCDETIGKYFCPEHKSTHSLEDLRKNWW